MGIPVSTLALAWTLRRPEISCAIIGATSPEHVQENVKATDVTLDDATLERIEDILASIDTGA
jgi:aryl-alcohol dehydrogenase-like predicted oxidoreductase